MWLFCLLLVMFSLGPLMVLYVDMFYNYEPVEEEPQEVYVGEIKE